MSRISFIARFNAHCRCVTAPDIHGLRNRPVGSVRYCHVRQPVTWRNEHSGMH